jgi:hypothetical protein
MEILVVLFLIDYNQIVFLDQNIDFQIQVVQNQVVVNKDVGFELK